MQCARCGAIFEGRFCPRCGAPAMAVPAASMGWPCPRCGTLFRGNFCPRCGLPTAAWGYRPPPPPSGGRSVLSVLWTLAMVGFIIFVITDFAALVAAPAFVVPGIQAIRSGQTVNSGLDFDTGNWTFNQWGSSSAATYRGAGGNPGGFLEMSLPSSGAQGYWWQAFNVEGSVPFTGAVHVDIEIAGGLTSGRLVVAVDSSNSVPDPNFAIGIVQYSGPTASWTAAPRFLADARLADPGVYYLKVAFIADSATSPVTVGFDNMRLGWTTDAAVVVYVPAPAPIVVVFTQDQALFITYFAFIAAVILFAAGFHLVRERREIWTAFRAPLEAIGTRLKSRSAWIALGQVWMAVTFFQVLFLYLVLAAGINPSSPVNPTPRTAWFWLFELANAGVYEEFAFRLLLIGLPMAIGSVALRILEVNRHGVAGGPGAAGRYIAGAWRYLLGGAVRRDSPKETLVASRGRRRRTCRRCRSPRRPHRIRGRRRPPGKCGPPPRLPGPPPSRAAMPAASRGNTRRRTSRPPMDIRRFDSNARTARGSKPSTMRAGSPARAAAARPRSSARRCSVRCSRWPPRGHRIRSRRRCPRGARRPRSSRPRRTRPACSNSLWCDSPDGRRPTGASPCPGSADCGSAPGAGPGSPSSRRCGAPSSRSERRGTYSAARASPSPNFPSGGSAFRPGRGAPHPIRRVAFNFLGMSRHRDEGILTGSPQWPPECARTFWRS